MEWFWNVLAPYNCLGCGQEDRLVCENCWAYLFTPSEQTDFCWAATTYSGLAKNLVHAMKVDARRQACLLIAKALHERAPACPGVIVTSVPTASARIRERGFDHGLIIAQEFARLREQPYQSLLIRHGRTKQAGASKNIRQAQIKSAYQLKSTPGLVGLGILIIDDVTTTGTTLGEIKKLLYAAGATNVNAIVFARSK